jgi:hypothetical protein
MNVEPPFDILRNDPRFVDLGRRVAATSTSVPLH